MRWAIFQRPAHPKLRISVETTLFTWRPRGTVSYACSFKSLKILHLFPIDVLLFFNLESIFLLEGQLSKLIQIWWHFAWAFSWERRSITYIDSPASQGACFSFLHWYNIFFYYIPLLHNHRILWWRPLGWILWWSRCSERVMKVFNDVVNSSMPLRLLVSQSCEGPSFTFFCFNATSRPSQHIRVHPGQQSPQAANWSLLWDHRSWALGQLASKILITLKAGVQFLIFSACWSLASTFQLPNI